MPFRLKSNILPHKAAGVRNMKSNDCTIERSGVLRQPFAHFLSPHLLSTYRRIAE